MSATAEEILTVRDEFERQHEKTVREEIERFRARSEELLAGNITEDEFRSFRLRFGIYGQRQPGVQMVRTKIPGGIDRKSTRLNSSHVAISYAVFCLKKKKKRAAAGDRVQKRPGL